MPDTLPPDLPPTDGALTTTPPAPDDPRVQPLAIESELKDSYLSYAMSVIVSRALPDVRDGLKPSQRRILVAMNDLNLGPASSRMKCAKITGQTTGDYHPHGTMAVYDTLVRMAQDWVMRHVLIDKQGNFGSIAGLPPAAERYTEARLSGFAAEMLADLDKDTVDMVPNYDGRVKEPMVLPSRFPNLLVNGSGGIAVGMATSIPPHNLGEVCKAVIRLIDKPSVSIMELMEDIPGPDFPTGGVICGRQGILDGYATGRGKIVIRARATINEEGARSQIVISDIPYQQSRNRIMELIGEAIKNEKITGISGAPRDESSERQGKPVSIVCDIKRDADPNLVLNQLYQFTPLQETFSVILLALVDGRPKTLNLKQMLEEYLRHRVRVIRRRTEFLLRQAKHRAHILEGQLIAIASIDEVIRICRAAPSRAEAKNQLVALEVSAAVMERALGAEHFASLIKEVGQKASFSMSEEQAEAVVRLQLGQLAALERDEIFKEYAGLRAKINEYEKLLSDQRNILAVVRKDMEEVSAKYGNERRTQIIDEGPGQVRHEDLITEEMNVVTISHGGYIKRLPSNTYRSQKRGGRGVSGGQTKDDDFVEHFFSASTHAYLLFFTNFGQVYWLKVYDIPQMSRTAAGRALPNVISLKPDEKVSAVIPVRRFEPNQYLLIATKRGLVKKTALEQYSRPRAGGIIGINLEEGDTLLNAVLVGEGDEVVLATRSGMAIRFSEADARPMGRDTKGVKGINLGKDDEVVGMAVADPDGQLLTVCQNGFGKRTPFGPSEASITAASSDEETPEVAETPEAEGDENSPSNMRYRTQRRGGKGLKDIRTSERNGPVVSTVAVREGDEIMVITQQGMVTRMKVNDFRAIGRNTQGVRLANLQEGDKVVTAVKLGELENGEGAEGDNEPAVTPEL
ncbi:MAG TPA: DNA gyrase subunit A [Gemmatales bacterium]|nr:DNA gyrase subunit A [Gemmatales bacterium]